MVWKIVSGMSCVMVILAVLFLALQGPEETFTLSEKIRVICMSFGYTRDALQFRSDVHLVEYFIVGVVMISFGAVMGWKRWTGVIIACSFGFLEETIKIFLPTREFGVVDLAKDVFGVWIAFILVSIFMFIIKRETEQTRE